MEKAKLPKHAAEVLEDMKAKGATLNEIVERHVHKDHIKTNGYGIIEQLSTDTLIRALYIGYEVEQTPEDKVRELYEKYKSMAIEGNNIASGAIDGIEETLEAFNIKIPGVND